MSINPTGYALGGNPLNSAPSLWSDDVEETTQQSENTSTYTDKSINPQGYNLGGAPTNTAPSLWGEDEKTTWTIEAEATVDDTTGTPDVDVTESSDTTTKTKTFIFEFSGLKGTSGSDGVGITSVEKTSTSGLVDTYTITFTNGTTTTFTVTNGTSGTDGVSPEVTIADITGGHRVTITDEDHPTGQNFDVMDGTEGTPGSDGVTPVISATASVGTGTGTPSVSVTKSGTNDAPSFAFAFDNLKGTAGTNGQGVPTGGTAGQVLTKIDGTDFNTQWTTPQSSSSYDGNYNVNYTTDAGTFFAGLYNRQIIPVQAYLYTNASTGNFVLYNRYKVSDNTSASGEQTPIAIRCKINFDLGQPAVGGGVVSGDGIIWYAVSGENDFKRKYNGKIEMNIGENAIDLRLSGGEFIFYDNDNPNFYYITTQGQRWGSYGPTITFANMSIFRGVYLKAQS